MSRHRNIDILRGNILQICHSINNATATIHQKLSEDPSFVFSEEYILLKNSLQQMKDHLEILKKEREQLQHCYNFILSGDYVEKDGRILRDYLVNDELTSTIDYKLGHSGKLSFTDSRHKTLFNLIKIKFGQLFLNCAFEMKYIIQMK
jgi:hypothetical protein